jgi:hypothetical protein
MTTTRKDDLTAQMRSLESQQEKLGEDLDGADIIGIIICVADYLDIQEIGEEVRKTGILRDLIEMSQSNPERAINAIAEFARMDEEIAVIDEDLMNLDVTGE